MNSRIKEICKDQGITLSELAEKIGMKGANLSVSLSEKGNPTYTTLMKIADALNVDIVELLISPTDRVTGYIEYDGQVYKINSIAAIEKLLYKIKNNIDEV